MYNSNKLPTRCNNFPVYYPDVYLQLNMFQGVLPPIIRSSMIAVADSGRPAWPRTQYDCNHNTKVKPVAATTIIELLMMGGKTPETC
jgi:hypothetical protein